MIYKLQNIDLNNITYSFPNGKKFIYIKYNDDGNRNPLFLELDYMKLIGGIHNLNNECLTDELYLKITPDVKNFFDTLDKKIVKDSRKNSSNWSLGNTNIKYKMFVKTMDVNNDPLDVIKLKFVKTKNVKTIVYNQDKKIVQSSEYKNVFYHGIYVKTIIEIVAIWIIDGILGLYVRPRQLRLKVINDMNSFQFEETDSEDFCDTEVLDYTEGEKRETSATHILSFDNSVGKLVESFTDVDFIKQPLPMSFHKQEEYVSEPNNYDLTDVDDDSITLSDSTSSDLE